MILLPNFPILLMKRGGANNEHPERALEQGGQTAGFGLPISRAGLMWWLCCHPKWSPKSAVIRTIPAAAALACRAALWVSLAGAPSEEVRIILLHEGCNICRLNFCSW